MAEICPKKETIAFKPHHQKNKEKLKKKRKAKQNKTKKQKKKTEPTEHNTLSLMCLTDRHDQSHMFPFNFRFPLPQHAPTEYMLWEP